MQENSFYPSDENHSPPRFSTEPAGMLGGGRGGEGELEVYVNDIITYRLLR